MRCTIMTLKLQINLLVRIVTNILFLFSIHLLIDSILHECLGYHTLVRSESPVSLSIICEEKSNLLTRGKLRSEVLLRVHSLTPLMPGKLRNRPRIGTRLKKLTATGKNPLQWNGNKNNYIRGMLLDLRMRRPSTDLNSKKNP